VAVAAAAVAGVAGAAAVAGVADAAAVGERMGLKCNSSVLLAMF